MDSAILAHKETSCRACGQGKVIDQAKTGANARVLIGILEKKAVAEKMGISPQYLGDLMADPSPRRPWNAELAEKFEAAVKALNAA